jgi:HEAT repeat protein
MIEPKFAGEMIDYLVEENGRSEKFINLFLAFDCFSELRNKNEIKSTSDRLLRSLKNILDDSNYYDRALVESKLREANMDTSEYMLLYETCTKAVSIVATFWREQPETFPWLKMIIELDKREDVRREAVQHLAWGWGENLETLSIIKNCLRNDKHGMVRAEAMEALLWLETVAPEILSIIKNCAKLDKSATVRRGALQELVHNWKDDPETLPILQACIQYDTDSSTRFTAVQELANSYKDEPDTLPILKALAQSADEPSIRWISTYKLCEVWKDSPDIFEVLCSCAVNDSYERNQTQNRRGKLHPRCLALETIIKQYPGHPQTLPLCKDRAENDPDEQVRGFLLKELVRSWKDESGMFEFLCNCALNDPFERKEDRQDNPRQLALEIIIKQYRDRPQTLPLLQDRAENDPDEKVREFAKKKLAELEK